MSLREPRPDPDWLEWLMGPLRLTPELIGAFAGGLLAAITLEFSGAIVFGMVIGGLTTFAYRQLR